jgi:hypothetical protein
MLRSLSITSLAVLVVLSGCKASTKPRTLMDAAPGEPLRVRKAPFNGEYRLFRTETPGYWEKPVGEPLATLRVRRGERVGFRRHGGELQAVAAAESVAIERGSYIWQMQPDKDQVDRAKTIGLVLFIAGSAALAAQVAFASSFSFPAIGPF